MSDEDIEYLKTCLRAGLKVFWVYGGCYQVIKAIGIAPPPKDDDVPEPSEVGYLEVPSGNYIALYGVDRNEIVVTSSNIAQWPELPLEQSCEETVEVGFRDNW